MLNPLIATLKPQSNGSSYSNTVIGTLMGGLLGPTMSLVQRGGDWRGAARPGPSSLYQM